MLNHEILPYCEVCETPRDSPSLPPPALPPRPSERATEPSAVVVGNKISQKLQAIKMSFKTSARIAKLKSKVDDWSIDPVFSRRSSACSTSSASSGYGDDGGNRDSIFENRLPQASSGTRLVLFDHFAVVALEDSATSSVPTIRITHKYSSPGASDISPSITSFCFADADQISKYPSEMAYPSETFTFVLTEDEGQRVFGFCRRFLPVGGGPRYPSCLCFLSRLPCFDLFAQVLEVVESRWKIRPGAVMPMLAAIVAEQVPRPGTVFRLRLTSNTDQFSEHFKFSRSDNISASSASLLPLFRRLSIDHILMLFNALLCERRIIICASSLQVISQCVHASTSMIFPLQWQHIFIPLLPHDLLHYTCAPMPFIAGVRSDHMQQVLQMPLQQTVVVDLDKDQVSITEGRSAEQLDFHMPEVLAQPLTFTSHPRPCPTMMKPTALISSNDNTGTREQAKETS